MCMREIPRKVLYSWHFGKTYFRCCRKYITQRTICKFSIEINGCLILKAVIFILNVLNDLRSTIFVLKRMMNVLKI